MAIWFMVASLVGHWVEICASGMSWLLIGEAYDASITNNLAEPYLVYGGGALICAYGLRPLYRRHQLHPLALFSICVVVCATVEFVAARILVARYGFNPFWDYSNDPLTFGSDVCLINTLLFAAGASLVVAVICPTAERHLSRLGTQQLLVLTGHTLLIFILAMQPQWQLTYVYLLSVAVWHLAMRARRSLLARQLLR
ncbi:MAG: putative ABC transporter permease [Propionibacteriaceae bacterium]|jgi:uncharacterized membrane protein|nr:putative ABC transporter permease [Propionibacteriaceae bacterium]